MLTNHLYKKLSVSYSNYDIKKAISFFNISLNLLVIINILHLLEDVKYLFTIHSPIKEQFLLIFNQKDILNVVTISHYLSMSIYDLLNACMISIIVMNVLSIIIPKNWKPLPLIISFLLYQMFFRTYTEFYVYGYDSYVLMSYVYLILLFSFKNKISEVLFFNVFRFHVSISYLISGMTKIFGFNWWNGESIWKAIHLYYLSNSDFWVYYDKIPAYFFIISGWIVIIVQISMPLLLIYGLRKYTIILLYLNLLIHSFIGIFLNLPFFASVMIIWNVTAFYFHNKL